jgi:methyl-accepting chemotaxis protein
MIFINKRKAEAAINKVYNGDFESAANEQYEKHFLLKQIKNLSMRLNVGKKKISGLLKETLGIATLISNFDLKLKFYSNGILTATERISEMASNVYSATEEAAASINQITNANTDLVSSLEKIALESDRLSDNTKKSNDVIQQIKSENSSVIKLSHNMKINVNDLISTVEYLTEKVEGIAGISDQTNLLALNASIEAARAGDAGKGFAVVADEIRKLSDTTKTMLNSINTLLKDINDASQKSSSSVNETMESMNRVNSDVEIMAELMTVNLNSISHISESLVSVAAVNEELNASMEEVTSTMDEISENAGRTSEFADELQDIGKSIHEMSNAMADIEIKVDTLAKNGGELAGDSYYGLSNDDFSNTVELAVTAHANWLANLKSMAENMKASPIQTDDHKCGFGHFYYSVKPVSNKILPLWNEVEKYHYELHKKGDMVQDSIKINNKDNAAKHANEAQAISEKIIDNFTRMVAVTKEMTLNGEDVFRPTLYQDN